MLGAPGSGKGTVSNILIEKHNFKHISTGDLLRQEVKTGSESGKTIDMIMKSGGLVSDEIVNNLVKSKINECKSKGYDVVLDGYPRTVEQAEYLNTYTNVDKVAELIVDKEILIDRISSRRVCPKCGDGYNIAINSTFKPKIYGICDKCGAALIQRKDDNPETIANRLKVYSDTTSKLIVFYKKQPNTKYITLDGNTGTLLLVDKILA